MIAIRTRKPARRKITGVRIRQHFAVLTTERRVRRVLEVRYMPHGVFVLVQIEAAKTITNLRRYHREHTTRRFAPNCLVLGGLVA